MSSNRWSSQVAFIFAAAAAAIGLGNIWRFPYLAGQNGGGAFVLIYLLFVIVLGIPLMTSEVVLGRIGRHNPVTSLANVAQQVKRSRYWGLLGGLTMLAGFLILTYYIVIAGWVLDYFVRAIIGEFNGATELTAINEFKSMQGSHWQMLVNDTLIAIAMMAVIMLGIKRGLERTVMIMFPALIIIMLILLGYAMTTGSFIKALHFLFDPNFHEINTRIVLMALGQAFFSLNVAMGVIIMFSAYLPDDAPLMSSIIAVVISDTGVAILAGMIIFPIVFANHLQPTAGPSLIFQTLPIAFGHLPFGYFIGALFFLLLLFAAFTSAISLLEVTTAWLIEEFQCSRKKGVLISGTVCWIVSLGSVFSFSHPKHLQIFNISFFDAIDFLTSGIMLPLGGLLIAVFTGWLVPKKFIQQQLNWKSSNPWFTCWRLIKTYVAPIAIALILLTSLKVI